MLFAFNDSDHWVPGVGDPTVVGWVTVVAYFCTALLCWRAARVPRTHSAGAPLFWSMFTGGLIFLGFNKQLDLQTWLTLFVKHLAVAEGWYEERRPVQALFIGAVAVVGAVSLAGLRALARNKTWAIRLALGGGIFLGCFILIRACSFHHVDQMLGMNFEGFKLNWILELGSISCIACAAWLAPRSRPSLPPGGSQNFVWVSAGNRLRNPPPGS